MLNEEISVVVQGPVQNYRGRIQAEGSTGRCLQSIRQHLPGATIVLSTWQGQALAGLDYDQLVISEDPGRNRDGFCPQNYHRQVLSTKAGLARVKTPYAMKMRGDNYLVGDAFKSVQQRYKAANPSDRIFEEKVVINSNLFRRFSRCREVILFPSDFFSFGRTTDLKRIWDQPLFPEQPFAEYLISRKKRFSHLSPLEAEQVYCVIWMHALTGQSPLMAHRFDHAKHDIEFWHRFVASNLVVFEPVNIGLGLRARSVRNRTRPNEFTSWDWLALYRKYCDDTVHPGWPRNRLTIELKRRLVHPFGRFWYRLTTAGADDGGRS